MNAITIIETIFSAGADSKKAMLNTLEDGAALKILGITDDDQLDVEQAYDMIKNSDIDDYLADGGKIGSYQW